MKNKDITEWILDEGIDPLTHIKNSKGQNIFLADILEKHLKEQLHIHSVIETVCDSCEPPTGYYLGMTCPECKKPFRAKKQTVL